MATLGPLAPAVVNYSFPVEIEVVGGKGSVATLGPLAPAVVNYSFPVEIEVVGGGREALTEQIFEELRLHFESLV